MHLTTLNTRTRPVSGFGLSLDSSSIASDVVNAVMPAIVAQIPRMVDAAWPLIVNRLPDAMNIMMPAIMNQLPAMVKAAMPLVQQQAPQLLQALMPTIQNQLIPVIEAEAQKLLDQYTRQYFGIGTNLLKFVPAALAVAVGTSLFASGLTICAWWQGRL